MAGIDKIYGTQDQYDDLRSWLLLNRPDFLPYMAESERQAGLRTIANFTNEQDVWLYEHCPFSFVREAIEWQYNGKPNA